MAPLFTMAPPFVNAEVTRDSCDWQTVTVTKFGQFMCRLVAYYQFWLHLGFLTSHLLITVFHKLADETTYRHSCDAWVDSCDIIKLIYIWVKPKIGVIW